MADSLADIGRDAGKLLDKLNAPVFSQVRFYHRDGNGDVEIVTRTASELQQFQHRLVEAEMRYEYETGRKPTHLVLGKREAAEYHAMMEWMIDQGMMRRQSDDAPKRMCYRGMEILHASAETMLVAVENPCA